MTLCAAQVTISRINNITADNVVNTWHYRTVGATSAADAAAAFQTALEAFYNTVKDLYCSEIVKGPLSMKHYDLSHTKPRVPILVDSFVWNPTSSPPLPGEMAMCLSYKGDYESGTANARRRGRVFLGPLRAAVGTVSGGDVRIHDTYAGTATGAATTLLAASAGSSAFRWVVYSPTTFGDVVLGGGDFADFDVTSGWVDNALDVQRRRGAKATVRTMWP